MGLKYFSASLGAKKLSGQKKRLMKKTAKPLVKTRFMLI
jgi:hypothetical protein